MHSTKRKNRKWTRAIAASGLALATLAATGVAQAHERGHRHHHDGIDRPHHARDRAAVRDARRYDRRLDRRGDAIDFQLDLLAMIAAAHGEYALAEHLDRKGDRIEHRLDRRGDRALRDARRDRRHGQAYARDLDRKHDRKWRRKLEREHDRKWRKKLERERRIERENARKRELALERKREHERERERNDDRRRHGADRNRSHVDALALHGWSRLH